MTTQTTTPARAMLKWRKLMGVNKADAARLLGTTPQNIGAIESFRTTKLSGTMELLMERLAEDRRAELQTGESGSR